MEIGRSRGSQGITVSVHILYGLGRIKRHNGL